jgi:thiaminase
MFTACTAYTRYVLDVGNSEDWYALQIALFPCLLGYHVIAKRLYDDPATIREGNRYWKWILNYVAEDYTAAVNLGCELIEEHAVKQSPSRIEELAKIFIHATNVSLVCPLRS